MLQLPAPRPELPEAERHGERGEISVGNGNLRTVRITWGLGAKGTRPVFNRYVKQGTHATRGGEAARAAPSVFFWALLTVGGGISL